jgi:hypothetical protein
LLLVGILASPTWAADLVVMKSGRTYEGTVQKVDDSSVVIAKDGMSFSLPRAGVQGIRYANVEKSAVAIPTLAAVLEEARKLSFSGELIQIPATVIDTGVLQRVPYVSYRIGEHVELNVYGDPERPGGIEIGLYAESITSNDAKEACLRFITTLLGGPVEPTGISLFEESRDLGHVTLEVTPHDAQDAYGAWWVSAYDEAILGLSRVSERELAAISIEARIADEEARTAPTATQQRDHEAWTAKELSKIRRTTQVATTLASELRTRSTAVSVFPTRPTGRVWVRSYVRKDGTFVKGHSRSR